jgi:hypothetical protein
MFEIETNSLRKPRNLSGTEDARRVALNSRDHPKNTALSRLPSMVLTNTIPINHPGPGAR